MKKIHPPEAKGKKKDVPVRSAHRAQAPEYRFLRKGEIKRKGDQFQDFDSKWKPITFVGQKYDPQEDEPVRRLVARSARRNEVKPEQSQRNPGVTPKSPTPKSSRRAG